jgi:hypothetical protein
MINRVTSLEISKQLKNAGWNKATEFWWRQLKDPDANKDWELGRYVNEDEYKVLPAPLVTEILEGLPVCDIHKKYYTKEVNDTPELYYQVHIRNESVTKGINTTDDTLPNALAKMWLYLKKEGLIK